MRIGPLRHRVTLQSPGETQSATGAMTKTWTNVATVWAQLTPNSGRAFFEAQQEQSEISIRVIIRYSSVVKAVDNTWRVQIDQSPLRYLNIDSVTNFQERDRMLSLDCSEGEKDD